MDAFLGRKFKILKDGVQIAGVQTKANNSASQMIDITDINSGGYREILGESGELQYDVPVEGVSKNFDFRRAILADTTISFTNCQLQYEDGYTTSGDVVLTGLSENGTYNDALKFSATLSFTGQI